MILALGDPTTIAIGLLVCFTTLVLSVVTMIATFILRRRSMSLAACSVASILFGVIYAGLLLKEDFEWCTELWFAIIPSVAGCISLVRMSFIQHDNPMA
jgi:cytochrome c biogenesis protein CcdA